MQTQMSVSLLAQLIRNRAVPLAIPVRPRSLFRSLYSTSSSADAPEQFITPEYLTHTRARIFGYRIGNGLRSGAKVLKKKLAIEKILNYYPTPPEKRDPFFVDPKIESRKAKLIKLKRRGKGPPKKGEGKRAKGKKKK